MPAERKSTRRRREPQASAAPLPVTTYRGPITRSRSRAIAAMNARNQNIIETSVNTGQARDGGSVPVPIREPPNRIYNRALAIRHLYLELQELSKDPPTHCRIGLIADNMFEWEVMQHGPSDTPYSNGLFKICLSFPEDYPLMPPKVRFNTKIFHCNVSEQGQIYLDLLGSRWLPIHSVSSILLSILSIITEPMTDNALELGVAQLYLNNRHTHDCIARQWTQLYAIEPEEAHK